MLWKTQHIRMIMYHHTKCFLHAQPNKALHHRNNKANDGNNIDQEAERTKHISHEKTVPRPVFELINPSNVVER